LFELLFNVTAASCSVNIRCSICPPCCWTTHSKMCCCRNSLVFKCCF